MSVILRRITYLSVICFISGCTSSLQINEITDTRRSSVLDITTPDSVHAAADIAFRIQKKSYSGNLVVKLKDSTLFDARVYSSLGNEIASVISDNQSVTLEYNDHSYEFSTNNAMDSMPFIWAKAINLSEFRSFFTGNLTPFKMFLCSKPDTNIDLKRNVASLRWALKDRNLLVEMIINRKKSLPILISLRDLNENSSWSIVFKNFHDGRAYSLLFKEDVNNYFSINYDKLKFFNGSNLL